MASSPLGQARHRLRAFFIGSLTVIHFENRRLVVRTVGGEMQGEHASRAKQNPCGRDTNCDSGEDITGLGSEGALTAHSAERSGQAAATTALQQDQADQEQS